MVRSLLYRGALFQRWHLMQGLILQDQSGGDYGNHSPTKDLIQDIGRIIPYAGGKRDMV